MASETLTIVDNRTGRSHEIPIRDGSVKATDLRRIKVSADDFGLVSYDPGFMDTAVCQSKITYVDGDKGILRYRGYPIEQLAERSTYLEVVYLLLHGELPTQTELENFTEEVRDQTELPDGVERFIATFSPDAKPTGMLQAATASLGSCYPEARRIDSEEIRRQQIVRLIAQMPILAALCARHKMGLPFLPPDKSLTHTGNFLSMVFNRSEGPYVPHPVLERAMEVLLILHADHEQNCSTNTVRCVGSAHADPYAAVSAGIGALSGPLHGGANEAVLQMLHQIGSVEKIPEVIKRVKAKEALLMGFGHRIYKSYDPRAKIIKQTAYEVFEVTGNNQLLEVALELERIALEDDYFLSRRLYPNVDFYSGLIYESMGFPRDMPTAIFAVARTAGWLAQWEEMLLDPEQRSKIARPRQIYKGAEKRDYVPISQRREA
jgi:citrate synthase